MGVDVWSSVWAVCVELCLGSGGLQSPHENWAFRTLCGWCSPPKTNKQKKLFWAEILGKKGACFPLGYNQRQLYDPFVVLSFCNCYERLTMRGCI